MWVVPILCKPWNNVGGSSEGSECELRVGKATGYPECVPAPSMEYVITPSMVEDTQCSQLALRGRLASERTMQRQYWRGYTGLCCWQVGQLPGTRARSIFCAWEFMFWGTRLTSFPAPIVTPFICPLCQHQGGQWQRMASLVCNRFSHYSDLVISV